MSEKQFIPVLVIILLLMFGATTYGIKKSITDRHRCYDACLLKRYPEGGYNYRLEACVCSNKMESIILNSDSKDSE